MKMQGIVGLVVLGLTLATVWASPIKKDRPDSDIDLIMQKGFGGYPPRPRLLQTILSGKASQKDKDAFAKLCEELSKTKPPEGSLEDWKKLTTSILEDARAVATGGEGEEAKTALDKLKKDTDCKACHDSYQRKKK